MATSTISIIHEMMQKLEEENKQLKVLNEELAVKITALEDQVKMYDKDTSCLLFKIQKVKQDLNNQNIKKGGYNKFNNYSYYELEDLNKPITDALIRQGLSSLFTFKDNTAYLQIIDSETGAWIQWQTPMQKSERYMKQFSNFEKKGDVGDLMKDEQALQTYSRRALYLQALEISEPNTIEQEGKKEQSIELPDNHVFKKIQQDFKKGGVPVNKTTLTNKLKSMYESRRISEEEYKENMEWVNNEKI